MNRKLTPEELRLWKAQLKGVKPLSAVDSEQEKIEQPKARKASTPPLPKLPKKLGGPAPITPLHGFDRKDLRRLKIDARLDLHGLSLEEGYHALHQFLIRAQERGIKTVLVITGKGSLTSENTFRHQLSRWLEEIPLRAFVSFLHYPAKPQDGGQGAFYVGIRKK